MRDVRMALLEADVNYAIVKDFTKKVTERAVGGEILESLTPAQQVIKIVNEELTALMGGQNVKLTRSSSVPTIYMMCGLQGAGKTTMCELQLFADGQPHGRDYQHRGHVVYERGDRAGEQRHQYGHPHHVFGFAQKYLRQAVGHLGRNEIIDDYHGARYHHQHVPVDGGKQALYGQYARDQENDRQRQRVSRTVFGFGDHKHVHQYEQDQSECFHAFPPSPPGRAGRMC